MSQDERRAGWLSRVFGAGGDPRGEGPSVTEEAVQPVTIIRRLEGEIANLRAAAAELEGQLAARGQELEEARRSAADIAAKAKHERASLLTQAQQVAAKLDAEAAARREIAERAEALNAETAGARAEIARAKEELGKAAGELSRERAKNMALSAANRHLTTSRDEAVKRAEERRAALEQEIAASQAALARQREAHAAEREGLQKGLEVAERQIRARERQLEAAETALAEEREQRASLQQRVEALQKDLEARGAELDEQRRAGEASARAQAEDHAVIVAGLAAIADRAVRALDLVLGRGAALAVRGARPPHAAAPAEGSAMPLAGAVKALERVLAATGWLQRLEPGDESLRISMLAGVPAATAAARALVAEHASEWLRAHGVSGLTVQVDAPPAASSPD